MQPTKIEWTDETWNPLTGCNRNCEYCYARKMANRLKGRYGYPADKPFTPTFHIDRLEDPYKLTKPKKIFVSSMGDLFANEVPDYQIKMVIKVACDLPQHTFMFLTKNPERYKEFDFPTNAWIGYSTPDELWYKWDERHEYNVKFVSLEPMKAPLVIRIKGYAQAINFDWLIIGAETGNRIGKYKIQQEWIDDVKHFCDLGGIDLFIKNSAGGGMQGFPVEKKPECPICLTELVRRRGFPGAESEWECPKQHYKRGSI